MCSSSASHVPNRIVILGAGHAAAQAVETLRRRGFKGSIVVVGDEPWLPYQRPPLSKKYLAGDLDRDRLLIRRDQYYAEHFVEMLLGRRAVEIERRSQRVRLDDASHLAYDALLIATGSRPRPLRIPGGDLDGVRYLRTIADVDALRVGLVAGGRIVIVGAAISGSKLPLHAVSLGSW